MVLRSTYPDDVRVATEARTLAADGHDVHLLCPAGEANAEPGTEVVGPITVRRIPMRERYDAVRRTVFAARFLLTVTDVGWRREMDRFVRDVDADVVHVHDLPLVRTARQVADRYDLPLVADLRENYPEAAGQRRPGMALPRRLVQRTFTPVRRLKRLEAHCVRGADRVLAVTEEGRRHYVEDCQADPESVAVVSNTVDRDRFAGDADPVAGYEDEFVLAHVGGFGPHRGLETAIDAMPAVVDRVPNARLLLVGVAREDACERRLRERAAETGVADRITFAGRVDPAEAPRYVAASDLPFVLHRDALHAATTVPHELFRYMAASKPVAVADVGALGRIVREADCGVVVDPEDSVGFADAAVAVAADPDRAETLGENARAAVDSRYNWAYDAATLRDVYGHLSWSRPTEESVEAMR